MANKKAPGKAEDFDPESHVELLLINEIRHEIMNFRPGFAADGVERTFFLSDAGSDWFTVTTEGDDVVIATPYELMKYLCFMDILNVTLLKKPASRTSNKKKFDPAFHIVFKIGRRELKLFGALRVRCSEKIAKLISMGEKVKFIGFDDNGNSLPLDEGRTFMDLYVLQEDVKSLHAASWEKYGIET